MSAQDRVLAPFRTRWQAGLLLVLAVWLALLGVELLNHRFRMVDLEVYRRAGQRFLRGEDLYRPGAAGDGYYAWKYSPAAAALFAPLAWVPLGAAKVAWWIALALVAVGNLWLALRLACPGYRLAPGRANAVVLACALATAVHVQLELHLGQVNQLVLALLLLAALGAVERRPLLLGAAAAASLALKPFALILLPWLLLRRRWRELGALGGAVGMGAAIAWARYGGAASGQLAGWGAALREELAHKGQLQLPANHTLASLVARYTPLGLLELRPPAARATEVATLAAMAGLAWWFVERGRDRPRAEVAELALLQAFIPLVAFTSANAYGAVLLAAAVLVAGWRALPAPGRALAVTGLALTGGNVYDLWGRQIFAALERASLVAVGAALLVGALAIGRRAGVH